MASHMRAGRNKRWERYHNSNIEMVGDCILGYSWAGSEHMGYCNVATHNTVVCIVCTVCKDFVPHMSRDMSDNMRVFSAVDCEKTLV